MTKKNLTHEEIHKTIEHYLQAIKLVKGEIAMKRTGLDYHKGWFYLRVPGHPDSAPAIPYRPSEVKQMTDDLMKRCKR